MRSALLERWRRGGSRRTQRDGQGESGGRVRCTTYIVCQDGISIESKFNFCRRMCDEHSIEVTESCWIAVLGMLDFILGGGDRRGARRAGFERPCGNETVRR